MDTQDLFNAVISTLDALDSSLTADQVYQRAKVQDLYAQLSELEDEMRDYLNDAVDEMRDNLNDAEDKLTDAQETVDRSIDTLNEILAETDNVELKQVIDNLQNINF